MKQLLKQMGFVFVLINIGLIQKIDAAKLYNRMSKQEMSQFEWIKAKAIPAKGKRGAQLVVNNKPGSCMEGGVSLVDLHNPHDYIAPCAKSEKRWDPMRWDLTWRIKGKDYWRSFKDTHDKDVEVILGTNKAPTLSGVDSR